jgi:hypothetical protein
MARWLEGKLTEMKCQNTTRNTARRDSHMEGLGNAGLSDVMPELGVSAETTVCVG